ncbi:MAG: hypothetical protein AAGB93_15690, partial [Planctomycetota bacterium]
MESPAAAVLVAIVSLSVFVWSLAIPADPGFSYDDREAIVGNPVVEGTVPAREAFRRDYWHHYEDAGHYRPAATLLLRWDRGRALRADGTLDPAVFRRTNVALHAVVLVLLGLALLRLSGERGVPVPWFGFGLLALHPACADVVAWISGRTSLVSALGAGVGLLASTFVTGDPERRRRDAATAALAGLVGTGLALLGKEDGVVLVVALPITCAWCGGRRAGVASLLGCAAAVGAVAALRAAAL